MKCPYKRWDRWFRDVICERTGRVCHDSSLECPWFSDMMVVVKEIVLTKY